MGYHPLYDLNVDVSIDTDCGSDMVEFLDSVVKNKLTLIEWVANGPAGPNATVRGTRKQITAWINTYYEPDNNNYKVIDSVRSESTAWLNIVAEFEPVFVA